MTARSRVRTAARRLGGGPVEWSAARAGLLSTLTRRPPRLELDAGPTVRGWVLRIALGAVGLALLSVPLRPGDGWGLGGGQVPVMVIFGAVVLALVGWPGSAMAAVVVALTAVRVLTGDLLGAPAAMGLVLGSHALLVLAAVCGQASWASWVEVGVLADAGRGVLRGQALALPLTAAAVLLAGIRSDPSARDWLRVVAVLAVLVTAVLVTRRGSGPLRR